mmetsp:Transcript_16262/g.40133  ORF Transcript_16262/g.40133 Transcript_16262/m.40133 type:complete len:352 (-) Transcript_16262:917-1972(-)
MWLFSGMTPSLMDTMSLSSSHSTLQVSGRYSRTISAPSLPMPQPHRHSSCRMMPPPFMKPCCSAIAPCSPSGFLLRFSTFGVRNFRLFVTSFTAIACGSGICAPVPRDDEKSVRAVVGGAVVGEPWSEEAACRVFFFCTRRVGCGMLALRSSSITDRGSSTNRHCTSSTPTFRDWSSRNRITSGSPARTAINWPCSRYWSSPHKYSSSFFRAGKRVFRAPRSIFVSRITLAFVRGVITGESETFSFFSSAAAPAAAPSLFPALPGAEDGAAAFFSLLGVAKSGVSLAPAPFAPSFDGLAPPALPGLDPCLLSSFGTFFRAAPAVLSTSFSSSKIPVARSAIKIFVFTRCSS